MNLHSTYSTHSTGQDPIFMLHFAPPACKPMPQQCGVAMRHRARWLYAAAAVAAALGAGLLYVGGWL